ncbi:hypothetical protein CTheo_2425 [Ceratobasidium theobromae]|uniref:Uncharacterized protein n=1 Tax=Ceratobasidium theobromae TaxID=1582974 RepID=A0A5N5QR35_9AGAM|nr:hypothetical protein CTheo_2425 [Ceratobasidium theobromae]
MPHKRAKRSVREAEREKRADLGPVESEMPKGIARVLGAEGVRAAYRARRAREKEGKESRELRVLAGEGLGALNRSAQTARESGDEAAKETSNQGCNEGGCEGAVEQTKAAERGGDGAACAARSPTLSAWWYNGGPVLGGHGDGVEHSEPGAWTPDDQSSVVCKLRDGAACVAAVVALVAVWQPGGGAFPTPREQHAGGAVAQAEKERGNERPGDGDDESSGSSAAVKEEQVSDGEYAAPAFAPTPPASARRVSPSMLPPLHVPDLARKRRRVTISGVAAHQPPPRPLHRTVLERAGGYAPPSVPSGMVSPVVTPGFNMSSPGALDQVRDTIAIRIEQKALIEQRKNGNPRPPSPIPATPTLSAPPPPAQTLAHRRGKASKLTIHTPSTSISGLAGLAGTEAARLGKHMHPARALLTRAGVEVAIRSAPPGVTRFDPASTRRPPPRLPQPPQPKERSVPIRRLHAGSTAAQTGPPAPLAIVAPGQPLALTAPYIATPTRTQFPAAQTPPPRHVRPSAPASPPISRSAFMAFYDAYAEVHSLRAQLDRMEREMDRRVELAVRDMRDEIRMLRDDMKRDRHVPRPVERSGSASVTHSPMQLDKRPLPDKMHMDKPDRPRLPGPADRLPPPPGERIPGPGERPPDKMDRLHPQPPRSALRKSPSVRGLQSSLSPPSRPPSVGAAEAARLRPKAPLRTRSPPDKSA